MNMAAPQPLAHARAFCPTCDGLGLVGDDDSRRYPTPCPVCDGSGLINRKHDQLIHDYQREQRLERALRGAVKGRHDDLNDDRVIGACIGASMTLAAIVIAVWALWRSGTIARLVGMWA